MLGILRVGGRIQFLWGVLQLVVECRYGQYGGIRGSAVDWPLEFCPLVQTTAFRLAQRVVWWWRLTTLVRRAELVSLVRPVVRVYGTCLSDAYLQKNGVGSEGRMVAFGV